MIEREAIKFIKSSTPAIERLLVGFSGGKDSIVVADLVKRSRVPFDLVYSFTGLDLPDVVRFIRKHYPHCMIVRPNKTFWHSITTRNPPLVNARWCCTSLKKAPTWRLPHIYRVMGIRKEESGPRSKYDRVNYFQKLNHYHLYPILDWNEADVWDYIEKYKLPYPEVYDEGLGRCGCIVCPYHTVKQNQYYRARYPGYFRLFEKQVRKWFYKRLGQGRTMAYDTPEEFLIDWELHKAVWYKKPKT